MVRGRLMGMWFVWAVGLLATPAQGDVSLQGSHPFDPSRYIQFQEFQALKETERNLAKLKFRIIEISGIEYVQLQSDEGAILLPANATLNGEALKEARCTESEPIANEDMVPTKQEYEISKRVQAYSGAILTTIERSCRVKPD